MSFLTEMTFRRMATISRTAARSSNFTSTVPRAAFSTTVQLQKNPVDATKDGLKKVDRVVSDKLVDGIDIGVAAKDKVKEASENITGGDVKGKAAELRGEAAGKAEELKGDVKGKAAEVKGEAKKKANEL
ncbi:hypothetical protein N8I77_006740 [Diaporthe amygdali]|uniref:Lea domain protein n=1 Tax=Phomopsis amygdali TaxID=1214568 RepID=A0AAD9W607_PHOAM|nr:lea domain-containing protein [Diaporthe amygdali]KAJ0117377.1 lea domain-containing protein [Diaporthe amygdali]KAK2608107.1 hypothetical protein N8I77_006740 [Diaporthe amygdali]